MKQGFFDLGLSTAMTPAPANKRGPVLSGGCDACGLYTKCSSPKMEVQGSGKLGILFIGESPSPTDDKNGEYFSGNTGRPLWRAESQLGEDFLRSCWFTWALRCHPGKKVTNIQIQNCRGNLEETIRELNPLVIIPLGIEAIQGLLGARMSGRISNVKPTDFIGEIIPDRDLNAWVCPTYGPYILTNSFSRTGEMERLFIHHLKQALALAKKGERPGKLKTIIKTTRDPVEAVHWIREARTNADEIAFDYETSGIKPHREGHRIATASFAYGDTGYSFPFFEDATFRDEWRKLLLSKKVGKIAHKADFESVWTHTRAGGYWPRITWDTCLGAHCLNNSGPTGLKFHTYVKLGVIGFDTSVDKFITAERNAGESGSFGDNHFNQVDDAPVSDLLHYNGLDSLFTLWLKRIQEKEFAKHPHLLTGFNFFVEAQQTIAKVQQAGMHLDREALTAAHAQLTAAINEAFMGMMGSPEGKRAPLGMNVNSDKQLAEFLYGTLEYPRPEEGSLVDEVALRRTKSPFAESLIRYRKLGKLRDTYLAQFQREEVGGIIRPFFNLHKVETFRSSSNSPNFQNIPKRDKIAQKTIRSLLLPRKGNRLIEYDYKAVEVCISACYHKDPTMIKYIQDPTTDMHRDTAMDLFFRGLDDFSPAERHCAKNGFVFPAFYGSTADQMAPAIWEMMPPETMEHLRSHRIKDLPAFQKHLAEIERKFWEERFRVYAQWKREIWGSCQKKGYVELHTGFRCWGPLKFTEATNYPIQGAAFHCLLWTLMNVFDRVEKISGRSTIIGQIHDAIVGDIHPEDEPEVDALMKEWGTRRIREHWPWIIVPLTLEKERSEIGGSWAKMEKCGVL